MRLFLIDLNKFFSDVIVVSKYIIIYNSLFVPLLDNIIKSKISCFVKCCCYYKCAKNDESSVKDLLYRALEFALNQTVLCFQLMFYFFH